MIKILRSTLNKIECLLSFHNEENENTAAVYIEVGCCATRVYWRDLRGYCEQKNSDSLGGDKRFTIVALREKNVLIFHKNVRIDDTRVFFSLKNVLHELSSYSRRIYGNPISNK